MLPSASSGNVARNTTSASFHVEQQQDHDRADQRQRAREQRHDPVGDELVERLHVVGQARDQHARLAPAEEADRLALQVREDPQPQVLQRALADPADQVRLQVRRSPIEQRGHRRTRRRSGSARPESPGVMPSSIASFARYGGARLAAVASTSDRNATITRPRYGRSSWATPRRRRSRSRPLRTDVGLRDQPHDRAALTSATSSSSGPPPSRPLSAARPAAACPCPRSRAYSSLESSSSSCVPCAAMRPPSITITRSASAIVERRCAITKRRAPFHHLAQRALDLALGGGVDARGGVVEHQHARVGDDRAGDRDALALAARQGQAALADQRVVAVGQALDELVYLRALRRQSRPRRTSPPGARRRCCRARSPRTGSRRRAPARSVSAAPTGPARARRRRRSSTAPLGHVVQARDRGHQRRLARPGRADDRDRLAGRDVEVDVGDRGRLVVVGERQRGRSGRARRRPAARFGCVRRVRCAARGRAARTRGCPDATARCAMPERDPEHPHREHQHQHVGVEGDERRPARSSR